MPSAAEPFKTVGDTSWFQQDRFGLFIHWGLYALPARHEWIKSREQMTEEHYDRYFRYFEPDLYDPTRWAAAAAAAGMKYFVVTTKHHEGFCLWDSKHTDYKSTQAPNCRRDLLRPMVDAFREQGIRVGFYHSLIDWRHPQYVIDDANHPRRQDPQRDALNQGRDQNKYADYLHAQVRELLTEFDDVDILWFDFSFPDKQNPDDFTKGKNHKAWRSAQLLKMIRELRPKIILDDRLDLGNAEGAWDIKTPEQAQPREWVHADIDGKKVPVVWEACQTLSGSWGYHRDEASWRSTEQLVFTLIDCVSKGGNFLLNVGPTARGEFDPRAIERLEGIGRWMQKHSRSIYGCTQAPAEFATPQDCRLTYSPDRKRLYVHVLTWPYKHLILDGGAYTDRVAYAQLLHDGSEVQLGIDAWHGGQLNLSNQSLVLNLPQVRPDAAVPVVELMLK